MQKRIKINDKELVYNLRRSRRARKIRLSIGCDAVLNATLPQYLPVYLLENFIKVKAAWVLKELNFFKNYSPDHRLVGTREEYIKNKSAAYYLAKEKLEKFNQIYGFEYKKIVIRDQKTRWGSCSSKGILNFNYKIVFLSEKLGDYLIVHELCHLKEMNHSRHFWKEVARAVPDYAFCRKELRSIHLR